MGEHKIGSSDINLRPKFVVLLLKAFRLLYYRGPEFLVYKLFKKIVFTIRSNRNLSASTALHWDREWQNQAIKNARLNWWDSAYVINKVFKNLSIDIKGSLENTAPELLKKHYSNSKFEKALSVGCGNGFKEMKLIQEGLVSHFDLFDLSPEAIKIGKQRAIELGISSQLSFYNNDPFSSSLLRNRYNLVFWNNSLHHMVNVPETLKISYDLLEENGVLYVEDYVGASRFQWNSDNLNLLNEIYKKIPSQFKKDPLNPGFTLPRIILRPLPEDVASSDPTEAIDSERILPSIKNFFPKATIYPIGGAIIHPLLNLLISNFDENNIEHLRYLDKIIEADQDCINKSKIPPHYAIAIAYKEKQSI